MQKSHYYFYTHCDDLNFENSSTNCETSFFLGFIFLATFLAAAFFLFSALTCLAVCSALCCDSNSNWAFDFLATTPRDPRVVVADDVGGSWLAWRPFWLRLYKEEIVWEGNFARKSSMSSNESSDERTAASSFWKGEKTTASSSWRGEKTTASSSWKCERTTASSSWTGWVPTNCASSSSDTMIASLAVRKLTGPY